MKIKLLSCALVLCTVYQLTAQTYSLKREPQLDEVQAFIDSLSPASKISLSLNFNANDLRGKPWYDKKYHQQQLANSEKELKNRPESAEIWADYIASYMYLYPKETEKINTLLNEHQQRLIQATKQKPDDAEANYYLSLLYALRTEVENAQVYASRAAELAPDSSKYKVNLAFRLKEMGEFETAKAFYREVLEKEGQNLDALIFLFLTDFFMKMTQANEDTWGNIQIDNSHIKSAYKQYPTQEIGLLLQSSELMNILYRTLFASIAQQEKSEAKEMLKNMASKDSQLLEIKKYFLNYLKKTKTDKSYPNYVLSVVCFLEGKLTEAYSYNEQAIRLSPERTDLYDNLIFMYISQEDFAQALTKVQQKMNIKTTAADYMVMAKIYAELGQKDKRTATLLKGLEEYPEDTDILFYLFLLAFEQKEYEKAKEYLSKSLTYNNQNADAITAYGALELLNGNTQEGFNALHYVKEKNSDAQAFFDFYFVQD